MDRIRDVRARPGRPDIGWDLAKKEQARPIRVLIADGDRLALEELRIAIEKNGRLTICAVAANAAGAVSCAMRERPDVCVLDVRLPGGALSATWEIGARLPRSKVLMLAASAEDDELIAAIRAGVQGYLLKTVGFGDLPAAIYGVWIGEAAMDPRFVARLLRHLRIREPRWRRPAGAAPDRPGIPGPPDGRLTSREWEVLDLLSQGLSTLEIARALTISTSAVRVHIAAVVRKLGVPDRAAAVAMLAHHDLPADRSDN
ncbi:MAG: response regulator transcription factor [Trebonia sp.]|jgi:DNA-binding NarL/FixJ family response regulator